MRLRLQGGGVGGRVEQLIRQQIELRGITHQDDLADDLLGDGDRGCRKQVVHAVLMIDPVSRFVFPGQQLQVLRYRQKRLDRKADDGLIQLVPSCAIRLCRPEQFFCLQIGQDDTVVLVGDEDGVLRVLQHCIAFFQ